jgi:hypothetical protein
MTKYILTVYGSSVCDVVWKSKGEPIELRSKNLTFGRSADFAHEALKSFREAMERVTFEGDVQECSIRREILDEFLTKGTVGDVIAQRIWLDNRLKCDYVFEIKNYDPPMAMVEFTGR